MPFTVCFSTASTIVMHSGCDAHGHSTVFPFRLPCMEDYSLCPKASWNEYEKEKQLQSIAAKFKAHCAVDQTQRLVDHWASCNWELNQDYENLAFSWHSVKSPTSCCLQIVCMKCGHSTTRMYPRNNYSCGNAKTVRTNPCGKAR